MKIQQQQKPFFPHLKCLTSFRIGSRWIDREWPRSEISFILERRFGMGAIALHNWVCPDGDGHLQPNIIM